MDTDLQCYSCSGASCDVCPPNTYTDCSCTHISEVAATECVSARPATEYGVVDTDLQCSSGSDASCDACPSQHLHRLQQHPHLGRGGAGGQHPITHVMIASRSVFGVDQPPAFDWRLANRTYLPIARMAVGSPGEHGAPRTTETLVASACALAPEEGDPPLIYGCRTQARPASLLPDGAFVCSNPAAVPN